MKRLITVLCGLLVAAFPLFTLTTHAQIDPEAGLPIIHTVYILSNASNNAVLRYLQRDGKPFRLTSYPTGGAGTGQYEDVPSPLALSPDGRSLCAVNPLSNNVSLFSVNASNGTLTLIGQPAAFGDPSAFKPVGVTISSANRAYVLYEGSPGNGGFIGVFSITSNGLSAIPGSGRDLFTGATPGQIALSPSQNAVVVSERATNILTTFALDASGIPSPFPQPRSSPGSSPYGITFNPLGVLFAADTQLGVVSSFAFNGNGQLDPVSPAIKAAGQEGTRAVVAASNSKFVFASNPLTSTISRFNSSTASPTGVLTVGQAVAAQTTLRPFDLALSPRTSTTPQFLYSLNRESLFSTNTQTFQLFRVDNTTGALTLVTNVTGIPFTANGLAAKL